MTVNLVNYENFSIRPGTSDQKAIDEVVGNKSYERNYFKPGPKDVWADIGANIGAFSRLYADRVKKIYAYEPSQESFDILTINTKEFNNVERIKAAVSDRNGTIEFYERPIQNWRNGTRNIFKDGVLTFVQELDARELPEDINALKIDCEGSELEIINALDFERIDKLVMEWSFDYHPEIEKYNKAISKLKNNFDVVKAPEVKGKYWKKSWFPPAKMVIAYNISEGTANNGESRESN